MKRPQVSVIIVNYNQKDLTRNCLKSLSMITYPNYEVILVDNGSNDKSIESLKTFTGKFKKIKFIYNNQNLGFVGGNNEGYKKSKGKYILILNNDTLVKNDFLEPLVDRMERNKKVGILQSKLVLMENRRLLDNVSTSLTIFGFLNYKGYLEEDAGQYDGYQTTFSAKGASMLVRKSILKIGLFDEDYFAYFEETDLCWRTWLMGYKVGFEPKSIVYHKMGATSSKMASGFIQYHSFKNRIRSILKNASLITLLWMLPIHLFITIIFAVYMLLSGKFKVFLGVIKAMLWNLSKIADTVKLRRRVQNLRKISDQELFRQVLYNPPVSAYFKHLSLLKGGMK